MLVGALAERQEYAVDWILWEKSVQLRERVSELSRARATTGNSDLPAFAEASNISWYLLHPDTKVSRPESFLRTSSFDCDGYRVYYFAASIP
jgi:hypothetical protein